MKRSAVTSGKGRSTPKKDSNKLSPKICWAELEREIAKLPFPQLSDAFRNAALVWQGGDGGGVYLKKAIQRAEAATTETGWDPIKGGGSIYSPVSMAEALRLYLKEAAQTLWIRDLALSMFLAHLVFVELWKLCKMSRQMSERFMRQSFEYKASNVRLFAEQALFIAHLEDACYTPIAILDDKPEMVTANRPKIGAVQSELLDHIGPDSYGRFDLGVVEKMSVRDLQDAVTIIATQSAFKFHEETFDL